MPPAISIGISEPASTGLGECPGIVGTSSRRIEVPTPISGNFVRPAHAITASLFRKERANRFLVPIKFTDCQGRVRIRDQRDGLWPSERAGCSITVQPEPNPSDGYLVAGKLPYDRLSERSIVIRRSHPIHHSTGSKTLSIRHSTSVRSPRLTAGTKFQGCTGPVAAIGYPAPPRQNSAARFGLRSTLHWFVTERPRCLRRRRCQCYMVVRPHAVAVVTVKPRAMGRSDAALGT